ncbi:MAG: MraY family glycosyltransferase [Candidatus Saelkia tenebricola]|nr:MraY family glycosyltransferase [Candidatus Saelkia tenebricola]
MNRIEIIKVALICFVFSFFLSKYFYKKNLKIGSKEESTFGGLVIFLTVLIGILVSVYRFDVYIWKIFILFSFMFLLGLWDDYKELSPFRKLFFQVIIVILALFFGFRTEIIYIPVYLNYLITAIWMLVIINAFNFLDIMDGLCLGNLLFVSLTFSIIGFIKFYPFNVFYSIVIFSSCLGFLPFNYKKAHAYLGDSGSLSLGFLLSIIAISFSYARETNPIALLTPVIILGLPMFDFAYVTIRRLLQGKSIFQKSPDHLAILMERNGISQTRITYKFCFISFGFAAAALVLQFGSCVSGIFTLILVISLFFAMVLKYYR